MDVRLPVRNPLTDVNLMTQNLPPSRRSSWTPAAIFGAFALISGIPACHGQTPSGWRIHDMQRPRPPVIAPVSRRLPTPAPADARVLFDGTNLQQWRSVDGGPARWVLRDGYMESVPDSGYLVSADGFGDVQLHVEWAAPANPEGTGQARGNSGVFLMGKYEIQVLDSYENETYADGQAAAIYGQYPPLVNACRPPGEWQAYDIFFRRPRFDQEGRVTKPAVATVVHNGVLVQDARKLWGPTSWLRHRPYVAHPARLPLALQDHGNPVRYRNIWLRELEELPDPSGAQSAGEYFPLAPDEMSQYAGSYTMEDDQGAEVLAIGETLVLDLEDRPRLTLTPRAEAVFDLGWTAGSVEFRVENGLATGLTLHLGGREYFARRNSADATP